MLRKLKKLFGIKDKPVERVVDIEPVKKVRKKKAVEIIAEVVVEPTMVVTLPTKAPVVRKKKAVEIIAEVVVEPTMVVTLPKKAPVVRKKKVVELITEVVVEPAPINGRGKQKKIIEATVEEPVMETKKQRGRPKK